MGFIVLGVEKFNQSSRRSEHKHLEGNQKKKKKTKVGTFLVPCTLPRREGNDCYVGYEIQDKIRGDLHMVHDALVRIFARPTEKWREMVATSDCFSWFSSSLFHHFFFSPVGGIYLH